MGYAGLNKLVEAKLNCREFRRLEEGGERLKTRWRAEGVTEARFLRV